jgi:hypothetical protein
LDKIRYRHIVQIIILLVLIALTAVLFFPVQRLIAERMDDLKRTAVERIETALGRHISYEKLSPSLFRHLKIEELTVHQDGPGGPALVEIRRVRVYYRLFKLLSKNPGEALYEVRIENTRLDLDLERDEELLVLLEDLLERAQRPDGELPLPDVTISGKNLDVSLSGPEFAVSSTDLFFTFEAGRENYGVDGRGKIELLGAIGKHLRLGRSQCRNRPIYVEYCGSRRPAILYNPRRRDRCGQKDPGQGSHRSKDRRRPFR